MTIIVNALFAIWLLATLVIQIISLKKPAKAPTINLNPKVDVPQAKVELKQEQEPDQEIQYMTFRLNGSLRGYHVKRNPELDFVADDEIDQYGNTINKIVRRGRWFYVYVTTVDGPQTDVITADIVDTFTI